MRHQLYLAFAALFAVVLWSCSDDSSDTVAGYWGDQKANQEEQHGTDPADLPTLNATARQVADAMTCGINIGNTMECPTGEGAWSGTEVTPEYIKGLKAAGFNAVRIPCAWDAHMVDKTSFTIDPAWLERVDRVVDWCYQSGLYVVLNAHWDNGWLEDHIFEADKEGVILAEQSAIWRQVATRLAKYDSHLLFAAMNEPGMNETSGGGKKWDAEAAARVVRYQQAMIDAVRAAGGYNATRCLVVQGLGASIDSTVDGMTALPRDPATDRMLVEVHFYEPYQFALMEQDASWGNTFWYWGAANHVDGSEHNATWGEEQYVADQMAKIKAKYPDTPVIIGEFAAIIRTNVDNKEKHLASVALYNKTVAQAARACGFAPFYWETGDIINRRTGEVKNADIVKALTE